MNEEKLKLLYETASQEFDLGSFEEFSSKMTDQDKRKSFYETASQSFDLGSFDDFNSKLSVTDKKKVDTASDQDSLEQDSELLSGSGSLDSPSKDTNDLEQSVQEAAEDGSFLNVLNNVGNTFQNIGNQLGIFVQEIGNLSSSFTDVVMDAAGSEVEVDTRLRAAREKSIQDLASKVDENNKQIDVNTIARSYDPSLSIEENMEIGRQGIVETFQKDGVIAGLGEVGIKAVESSPYVISSILTGATGGAAATASTFFATGYGGSIAEQYIARESQENPEQIQQSRAIIQGTIEGLTSVMFGGVSKYAKEAVKTLGKDQAKKIIKNNISNQLKNSAKSISGTALGEGFEEMTQEVASYAVDVAYESDNFERDFNRERAFEIGMDALILGAASGAGVSGIGSTINGYKYAKAKAKQNKSIAAINEELQLQSTKDNPMKEKILTRKRDLLLGEIDFNKEISDDDAKKLDDLYFEQEELNQMIKATQNKDLRNEMKEELSNVESEFNQIFDKYDNRRPSKTNEGEAMGDQGKPDGSAIDGKTRDGNVSSSEQTEEINGSDQNAERNAFEEVDDRYAEQGRDAGEGEQEIAVEESIIEEDVEDTDKPLALKEESRLDRFRRKIQDQSLPIKRLQQDVEQETGKEVTGTPMDAYNKLDLEKNISSQETVKIYKEAIVDDDSFVNRHKESGVSFTEDGDLPSFGRYAFAKHAKERNARIKEIGNERASDIKSEIDSLYEKLESTKDQNEANGIKRKIRNKEEDLEQIEFSFSEKFGSGMTDEESDQILNSLSDDQKKAYDDC